MCVFCQGPPVLGEVRIGLLLDRLTLQCSPLADQISKPSFQRHTLQREAGSLICTFGEVMNQSLFEAAGCSFRWNDGKIKEERQIWRTVLLGVCNHICMYGCTHWATASLLYLNTAVEWIFLFFKVKHVPNTYIRALDKRTTDFRKPYSRSVHTVSNVVCVNDGSCQVFLFGPRRPVEVGSVGGLAETAVRCFGNVPKSWACIGPFLCICLYRSIWEHRLLIGVRH